MSLISALVTKNDVFMPVNVVHHDGGHFAAIYSDFHKAVVAFGNQGIYSPAGGYPAAVDAVKGGIAEGTKILLIPARKIADSDNVTLTITHIPSNIVLAAKDDEAVNVHCVFSKHSGVIVDVFSCAESRNAYIDAAKKRNRTDLESFDCKLSNEPFKSVPPLKVLSRVKLALLNSYVDELTLR